MNTGGPDATPRRPHGAPRAKPEVGPSGEAPGDPHRDAATPARPDRVSVGATFAAMRSVPFRWLWTTTLASTSGRFATLMVTGWLAYRITGSPVGAGLTSLLAFAPALFIGPVSGALADRLDRRRLIQAGSGVASATCLVAAGFAGAARLPFGLVLLVALAAGVGVALEQPSRVSLVSLVSAPEDLLNAFSLIRIPTQGAEMVGPAVATAALVGLGPAAALAACGAFYLLAVLQAPRIAVPRHTAAAPPGRAGVVRSLGDGLAYVRQEKQIGALLVWVGLH